MEWLSYLGEAFHDSHSHCASRTPGLIGSTGESIVTTNERLHSRVTDDNVRDNGRTNRPLSRNNPKRTDASIRSHEFLQHVSTQVSFDSVSSLLECVPRSFPLLQNRFTHASV